MQLARKTPAHSRAIQRAFRFPKNLTGGWQRHLKQSHSTQSGGESSPPFEEPRTSLKGTLFQLTRGNRNFLCGNRRSAFRLILVFHDRLLTDKHEFRKRRKGQDPANPNCASSNGFPPDSDRQKRKIRGHPCPFRPGNGGPSLHRRIPPGESASRPSLKYRSNS